MEPAIYRIVLNLNRDAAHVSLGAQLGDTARQLRISLMENGKPYRIGEGCHAVLSGKKPDGKQLFNDCVINDSVIIYDFTPQTANVVGRVKCEIILYGSDGRVIASSDFEIIVHNKGLDARELLAQSETEVNTLNNLIVRARNAITDTENANNTANQVIKKATAATDSANAAAKKANYAADDVRACLGLVLDGLVSRTAEVSLPANAWIGDTSPYWQVVEIDRITSYSKVDLLPTEDQIEIFGDRDISLVAVNEDGVVTVYATGAKPKNDYIIKAQVTEVAK